MSAFSSSVSVIDAVSQHCWTEKQAKLQTPFIYDYITGFWGLFWGDSALRENRLGMFKNRVLRRIFVSNREEILRGWKGFIVCTIYILLRG
jgi:hypothetical protein